LILDAECDPNAIFIFKIDGAFSSTTLSNVILINAASACNIYWQINGAVSLGEGSVFRGNILANGAISLLEGSSLYGRGLSRAGAIDMHNNIATLDLLPTASVITAGGPTTFCDGGSVTLSGNCGGIWSNGSSSPSITVTTSDDYFVTTYKCMWKYTIQSYYSYRVTITCLHYHWNGSYMCMEVQPCFVLQWVQVTVIFGITDPQLDVLL
jgi:hypothetical protein